MQTEIEAKFPDIDVPKFRARLKEIGAKEIHGEIPMRRRNFDFPSRKQINGWVRVRDEGDKITLAYKQLDDRGLHGTKEISVVVDDFEKISDFLLSIGLILKSYQETRREKWKIGEVEVTIDTWPWIPTFVELEGPSEEAVRKAAADLGLDWSKATHGSVEPIYQMHYDFTDDEIDNWPLITFTPEPEWLLAKKKY